MKTKPKNLPPYLLKFVKVRHLRNCALTMKDLEQLSADSPHQTVREFAKWKLRKVGVISQN